MAPAAKAAIERRLSYLHGLGLDISLDKDATGWKVETAKGSRPLSHRMKSTTDVIGWLEAFETGYEMGKEAGVNAMRKGRVDEGGIPG